LKDLQHGCINNMELFNQKKGKNEKNFGNRWGRISR
jgi:hypothetical protein